MLEPRPPVKREPSNRLLSNLTDDYIDLAAVVLSSMAFQDPESFGSLATIFQYGGLSWGLIGPIGDLFRTDANAAARTVHAGMRLARNILFFGGGYILNGNFPTKDKLKNLTAIAGIAPVIELIRMCWPYNDNGDTLLDRYKKPEPLSK